MSSDPTDGVLATPVEYICRVCTTEFTAYVSPIETEEGYIIDLDSKHRLFTHYCSECDEHNRTAVAKRALSSEQ